MVVALAIIGDYGALPDQAQDGRAYLGELWFLAYLHSRAAGPCGHSTFVSAVDILNYMEAAGDVRPERTGRDI